MNWEALCNHCGDCCRVFDTGFACPLYSGSRCGDYENRQQRVPQCSKLTPENTMELYEKGVLSDRCNYVRKVRGEELIWDVKPTLKPFKAAPIGFQLIYWKNV